METVRNLDKGGGELSFYRYAYDHSGFITSEEVRQRAEGKTELFTNTYTYDNQGQLVLASTLKDGKTSEIRYTYDKAGNRIALEKNEDTILAYLEEYAYDEANRLMTASSEKERKLCASAGRISKGDTDGVGVVKGISQAITDIWNKSMSENPIGKVFLNQGKKTAPSIGSTVMEIAQRVIKEQEEQRKEWERVLESRYELQHMEDSGTEGVPSKGKTEIFGAENVTTKEKIEELAQLYGSKKYEEREELIASPLINLTARVIYGEQTEAGEAQDIVAWTMINRVLSQKKEHTGGREVTLYNVLTTPKQYTVLDKEQNNTLSFDGKEPGTSGWDGWQHAFELAYQIDEILGDVGENTTQEELDAARRKLEEAIGESPIGTGRFFRAEKDFYAKLSESIEGNELISYYENTRIKSDYVRKNGNVFFEYY